MGLTPGNRVRHQQECDTRKQERLLTPPVANRAPPAFAEPSRNSESRTMKLAAESTYTAPPFWLAELRRMVQFCIPAPAGVKRGHYTTQHTTKTGHAPGTQNWR